MSNNRSNSTTSKRLSDKFDFSASPSLTFPTLLSFPLGLHRQRDWRNTFGRIVVVERRRRFPNFLRLVGKAKKKKTRATFKITPDIFRPLSREFAVLMTPSGSGQDTLRFCRQILSEIETCLLSLWHLHLAFRRKHVVWLCSNGRL